MSNWLTVPDCGGLIEELAISLPQRVFDSADSEAECFKCAIANLLKSLPDEIHLFVFADEENVQFAKTWVGQQTDCKFQIVSAGAVGLNSSDIWTQDPILVQTNGDELRLLAPGVNWLSDLPRLLAVHTGADYETRLFFLPGGDQIVGDKFRIVGHNSRIRSADLENGGDGTIAHAENRIAAIDAREVFYWGYRLSDLPQTLAISEFAEFLAEGSRENSLAGLEAFNTSERLDPDAIVTLVKSALNDAFRQEDAHLDRFVTVTGRYSEGKPVLFLAEPVAADEYSKKTVAKKEHRFIASKIWLEEKGFKVCRNKVPYAVASNGEVRARLYNNVILENEVRNGNTKPIVWLPCFGENEKFAAFDNQNAEMWEEWDFLPLRVYGWENLAHINGALRCVSKVVRRAQ